MTYQEGELLNPLGGFPVLGGIFSKVDLAFAQLGLPLWVRAFLELALSGMVAFLLLRLLTNRVLPWAGTALVEPVITLVEGVRIVLLLPDLAISRTARRFGRLPPEPVYAYGSAIMTAADSVQRFARHALPMLAVARKLRPWVLVSLLAIGFLIWNSQACAAATCTSPITIWQNSFTSWIGGLL